LLTYQSILGPLGHNLVNASSGLEALEKLLKDEFAAVLLDVSMPEIDGFEVATLIHRHPRFESDYVSIPVVPEIVRSKVAVLVDLHCKRRDLQTLNRTLARTNAQLEQANITLQAPKRPENSSA
jgi:CheY-like chemotaxis protein